MEARCRVAVLGAGVVGCSVAYLLSERLKTHLVALTLISENFSPDTTSNRAGALVAPFDLQSGSGIDSREERWLQQTMEWLTRLYNSRVGGKTGVTLVHGCYSHESLSTPPWWSRFMLGFREIGPEEKRMRNMPADYPHVFSFSSYMVDCCDYLPWLMSGFQANGGVIERPRHVITLNELHHSFDVIINCTGLGARQLVKDMSVYPVRGDAVVVRAPWIKEFVFLIKKDLYTYVFPRSTTVLLGGTGERDWSEAKNQAACVNILKRCEAVVPSLASCEVLSEWAGLRPVREQVRLEVEEKGGTRPLIMHCYGHGGKGITYSWGCAEDVSKIVEERIKAHLISNL